MTPIIVVNGPEVGILYEGIGALFITNCETAIVVEAVAIAEPGEPRAIVEKRHAKLNACARELFGDNLEFLDPLGLRGGAKAVPS